MGDDDRKPISAIEREYAEEVGRTEIKAFVRDITDRAQSEAVTFTQRADILRKVADQIERAGRGDPVARTLERVREREAWPNRQFFQKTPAKPSEEMRRAWIDDHRACHGKPARQWGLLTKPEPRPVPSPAEQAAQLKARADDVKPMQHFGQTRTAHWAAQAKAELDRAPELGRGIDHERDR